MTSVGNEGIDTGREMFFWSLKGWQFDCVLNECGVGTSHTKSTGETIPERNTAGTKVPGLCSWKTNEDALR